METRTHGNAREIKVCIILDKFRAILLMEVEFNMVKNSSSESELSKKLKPFNKPPPRMQRKYYISDFVLNSDDAHTCCNQIKHMEISMSCQSLKVRQTILAVLLTTNQ